MKFKIFFFFHVFCSFLSFSQSTIKGNITSNEKALEFATINIVELKKAVKSNENGVYSFQNIPEGSYTITCLLYTSDAADE